MVIEFHYIIADISNVMGAYCVVAEIIKFPICIGIIQVPDICRGNPGLRRITSCSFTHRDLPVLCVINSGSIYPDSILRHGHIRWQNISHGEAPEIGSPLLYRDFLINIILIGISCINAVVKAFFNRRAL